MKPESRKQSKKGVNDPKSPRIPPQCREFAGTLQLGRICLYLVIAFPPPPGYHAPGVVRFGAPDLIEVWMLEIAVIR